MIYQIYTWNYLYKIIILIKIHTLQGFNFFGYQN